jgi:hypothetical protein
VPLAGTLRVAGADLVAGAVRTDNRVTGTVRRGLTLSPGFRVIRLQAWTQKFLIINHQINLWVVILRVHLADDLWTIVGFIH